MFVAIQERPRVYRSRINREEIAPGTYRKLFRFDKENVEWLADTFLPENYETRGGVVRKLQEKCQNSRNI